MAKQFDVLEESLGLPPLSEAISASENDIASALEHAKELEQQLSSMDGFDQHDAEMDELASLAVQAHKDLQDLGMNVEIRHAGEIFTSSSQMLKIAVDAKHNKVEKKLKLLRLQLDKMRIERMSAGDKENMVDGTAMVLDRNELLKQLRQIGNEDK